MPGEPRYLDIQRDAELMKSIRRLEEAGRPTPGGTAVRER